MKIHLERVDDTFHLRATNETGNTVDLDNHKAREGTPLGAGPMQLLVMALGGCSGIDIIAMLKKARQPVDTFAIDLDSERDWDAVPALYKHIHAHYMLTGALEEKMVRRVITLSLEKYCSVAKTLEATAEITFSFSINGVHHAA